MADDSRFPIAYSKRAKEIGRYFRAEFRRLRNQIEGADYWHAMILENYRYKGDALYKAVRSDLKDNAFIYKEILDSVDDAATIAHISHDYGQLDLLLALDSIDRKIVTYLENPRAQEILKHNYLTQNYSKITVVDTIDEVLERSTQVLIIESPRYGLPAMDKEKWQEIGILIFLKKAMVLVEETVKLGFEVEHKNQRFTVLKNPIFTIKEQ